MNRRCLKGFVTIAMIFAMVGHWGLLQSVAWVGMAVRFAQQDSITVAIQRTFDGNHPCRLCLVVRTGKSQEKEQSFTPVQTKLDFLVYEIPVFRHPLPPVLRAAEEMAPRANLAEEPPLPPPRFA